MNRSIPFGKERGDFAPSTNSIWWKVLFHLERRGMPLRYQQTVFDEKVYSIWKGEGWLFALNKQYLMKRFIPFGKERDDFSLSINSIWWKGLFHLERRGMTLRYQQTVFDEKVYSIWKGEWWLCAMNKQYLMKRSIPFGKERDDFSLLINSISWKGLFHLERRGMTFRSQ